jgi:hypothetical protein
MENQTSTEPTMIFYIAYAFIALTTAIVVYDDTAFNRRIELIASAVTGATWPLLFTVKIISKILN